MYNTSFYKATINDVEVPIDNDLIQDNNISIAILHSDTSTHSSISFLITNRKGGLMSFNSMESTWNDEFVETSPNKSPLIPKGESFLFSLPLSQGQIEKIVLLDEVDYNDSPEYEKAHKKFNSRIEEISHQKPTSKYGNYFSFVIHFYNDEYYYYKVLYSLEGVRYDYKIYTKEYGKADKVY